MQRSGLVSSDSYAPGPGDNYAPTLVLTITPLAFHVPSAHQCPETPQHISHADVLFSK